ncbi:MAG: hypothetical protein Ct9H90mP22_8060 [Gammaproteobacteria bacterium]|nr:MAG: hypothetical protein Ct9H90mP22_8060 [Gammaproteobacteria bacterium]
MQVFILMVTGAMMRRMKKDVQHKKKILGLSLLEALISTAIVGIGFIAILQMTNYSFQSIYTSGREPKLII